MSTGSLSQAPAKAEPIGSAISSGTTFGIYQDTGSQKGWKYPSPPGFRCILK